MPSRRKIITLIILAGALLVWALFLFYRESILSAEDAGWRPMLGEGVRVFLPGNARIASAAHGRMEWTLLGRDIKFYEDKGVVEVDSPLAWVPVEDGGTLKVSSPAGRYFTDSEDMELGTEVHVMLVESGNLEWTLDGDTASYRREEKAFYVSRARGMMHVESGDTIHVKGDRGRYDAKFSLMSLSGGVEARWAGGMTLATERLDYLVEKDRARTDSPVHVKGSGWTVSGLGLEADLVEQKVIIPEKVEIVLEHGLGGGP